jgi:alpha-maltose-1-phosphate synthase
MRIAILTSGRFHLCDLARELDALGHDVLFYSCLPRRRSRQFGLPDHCARSMWPWVAPAFALMRATYGTSFQTWGERVLARAIRLLALRQIEPCDVFIGLSGISFKAALLAREKYGATIWIERGSRHILSQRQILNSMSTSRTNANSVSTFAVKQELADYEVADRIAIPARHVEQSFLENGISASKLFVNPYGVDLQMFAATSAPSPDPPTILMVGAWSLRKGCDVLVKAWQTLKNVRLIHVGPVYDLPLPSDPGFEHFHAVPQERLRDFYGKAHVFVLASREEGMATVQLQALACGLHLVCSDRTGGEDLKQFLEDPDLISVVPSEQPGALAEKLSLALERSRRFAGIRDFLRAARSKLSWSAYGQRYSDALTQSFPGTVRPNNG